MYMYMITLFATIIGFIGSVMPELLRLVQDFKNKKHYIDILNKNFGADSNLVSKFLSKNDTSNLNISNEKIGINWVDAFNSMVRPVLAYSFFIIYVIAKFMQYHVVSNSGSVIKNINILWTTDDQAAFAGIISFYFGQRTFSKLWNKK